MSAPRSRLQGAKEVRPPKRHQTGSLGAPPLPARPAAEERRCRGWRETRGAPTCVLNKYSHVQAQFREYLGLKLSLLCSVCSVCSV